MASNRPPLPIYSHLVTPARRTNTFQGGQRPSNVIKLASSTMSLNGNETPLNKTHLFSPTVHSQSPSSNDHLLKYDIRRLRASLERKEEQISWWMEKSKNDSDKFEALKCKLDQINHQHDLTLQCVRSTFDGLTCMNRSIHVIFMQEDKENKFYDNEQDEFIEENLDENISLVLLSRLNHICIKLAKNIDLLLRTLLSSNVSSIKQSHPIQRHESNASSISKQSTIDDVNDTTNIVYEEIIDKLNHDLEIMKIRLLEQENRTKILEEELSQCKSAHLSAKITFDTHEKKFHEQLILKDKQIISIATNEHDVLRQLLDEKTIALEQLNEEYISLMTKYQSEYNRNVDCMIKTDALHEHIRLLSETLTVKEINEEKLITQQQQMKKLMTLLIPTTSNNKKSNDKKTFGRKVRRHLRESFSSLVNHKQTSNNQ